MKNKIEDLRNHLFSELERLGDEDIVKNPMRLEAEIKRANAIASIGTVLVASAKAETDFLKSIGKNPGSDFIPIEHTKPKQIEP